MGTNRITELPPNLFSDLSQCTQLSVADNQLTALEPGTFNGLVNLEKLWLSDNKIAQIPANIFSQLSRCTLLVLNNNEISNIEPGSFNGLDAIEVLWLGGNRLTSLSPAVLQGLPRPLELALSVPDESEDQNWDCLSLCWLQKEEQAGNIMWKEQNGFVCKPRCFDGLHWDELDCAGQCQLHVQHRQVSVTKSQEFSLHKLLFYICFSGKVRNMGLTQISEIIENVTHVDLSNNQISEIPPGAFGHLADCILLNLAHNLISEVSNDTFTGLTHLITLDLSFNQIEMLESGTFLVLTNITQLYLNNNKLRTVPLGSFRMQSLAYLTLQGNQLSILYQEDFALVITLFLGLSNHTQGGDENWDCCSLTWMKSKKDEGKLKFILSLEPECSQGSNITFDKIVCGR